MIWKQIPGFSAYEASEKGKLRRASTRKVLRPAVCRQSGYAKVTIYNDDGDLKTVSIHRAVCSAFHGAPEPGWEVRHLDGNKRNCAAANMSWGTRRDNAADRAAHMAKKGLTYTGLSLCRRVGRPTPSVGLGSFWGSPKTLKSIRGAYKDGLISKDNALELIEQLSGRRSSVEERILGKEAAKQRKWR